MKLRRKLTRCLLDKPDSIGDALIERDYIVLGRQVYILSGLFVLRHVVKNNKESTES
jgi:hypothetical protein